MTFTVLGASGFIGRNLVQYLQSQNINVQIFPRGTQHLRGQKLGHVIYAIGMTGNFRQDPAGTIDAHVTQLQKLMDGAIYESWLYLSSTRIYAGLEKGLEDAKISISPSSDSLYDLTKLLGEAFCLAQNHPHIRIARLSNIFGYDMSKNNFLGAVIAEARDKKHVTFHESPPSAKDYLYIDDCIKALTHIAQHGTEKIYNIASGHSTTHQEIADILNYRGCTTDFAAQAATRRFPPIDTQRLQNLFPFKPVSVTNIIPTLLQRA